MALIGRPRRELDQSRLDWVRDAWVNGRMSLRQAARHAHCSLQALRLRWPEFAEMCQRRRDQCRCLNARARAEKRAREGRSDA